MNTPGRSSEAVPDIDWSELEGRTYRCVDGCALCCLCQPELLPDEERAFRGDPKLSEGVSDRHISPEVRGAAIRLRGDHGACYFLQDRRCTIYASRPHYCRAFPINIYAGWRMQLNANLSCRGMGLPGEQLTEVGRGLLHAVGEERLREELEGSRRVFDEFKANTRDAKVAQSFESLRESARILMDELADTIGISKLLTYAEHGRTRQNSPAQEVARLARKAEPEANIEMRALMDGTELFDLPELSHLPIYIGPDLSWRIFRLEGPAIAGYVLREDGGLEEFSRTDPTDVELVPFSDDGRQELLTYLAVVNARDCFAGHAAHLCDSEGYDFNLAQVYLGALANNSLDLWWRASFLAHMAGKSRLGRAEVREGIVFFDMDLLDLPTIGAFV